MGICVLLTREIDVAFALSAATVYMVLMFIILVLEPNIGEN